MKEQGRRIKHEFLKGPGKKGSFDNSFFEQWIRTSFPGLIITKDVGFSRTVIASMLAEALNEEEFYLQNSQASPAPDELDRLQAITFLQQMASSLGLLSGEEIRYIQSQNGQVSAEFLSLEDGLLPTYSEVVEMTQEWKAQGLAIYFFHGGFDPPTAFHLGCATESYVMADHQTNGQFRLLIGFDSNESLRVSKGKDRPRFSANERRKIFGSFWMADATVETKNKSYSDNEERIRGYQELNIDYVLMSLDQQNLENRLIQIKKAGAEPRFFGYNDDTFHATEVLKILAEG